MEDLGELLESYRGRAQAWAFKVLKNASEAEEVVGQAYLKAIEAAGTLRDPEAFSTWLYRMVFRMSLNALRDRATERRSLKGLDAREEAPEPAELPAREMDRLRAALEKLPLDQQIVLTMHYWRGLTYAEIARELEVPEGTVKVRAFRAHQRLKGLLAPS